MPQLFGFDAFSPREIAERVEKIGVAKARLPLLSMALLGVLAGAFIGLGALFYVLVIADATLGFAAKRVLGGAVFSLGLILVTIANMFFIPMGMLIQGGADPITPLGFLGNLVPVILGNLVGGSGLVAFFYYFIYRRGNPLTAERDK